MSRPIIGITVDNRDDSAASGVYESTIAYSRAITRAGGVAVLLPHEAQCAARYVELCDGLVLTGGVDPRTEAFGEPTHPLARPMDAARQAFELALLKAIDDAAARAVLGVCLGMQLMALHRGGRLDQYLPDTLAQPQVHSGDARHAIEIEVDDSVVVAGEPAPRGGWTVVSSHRQAVADPGSLRTVARAADGVIEAIDDPDRRFYAGVQWHPERAAANDPVSINQGLYDRLVGASVPAK